MRGCLTQRRKIDSEVKRQIIIKINEIQHLLDVEYHKTRNEELIHLYNSFGVLASMIANL